MTPSIFRLQRTWHVVGSFMLLALLVPRFGHAEVARVEMHVFKSTTLTDQEFLTGQKEGKAVVIAGELRIPKLGNDRLPAVVLVHGSGGVSGFVDDWAQWFNAMGIATFVFDSFTPRGIVNTLNDQEQLGRLAMIVDAYRALEVVAKHPRVDPERIVLMGFSRGGGAALYASMKRFQRMHSPTGAAYAAYIAFYPPCNATFLGDEDVADKPIRIFLGSADEFMPMESCRLYVERLRRAGKDVQLTEYAGAHHIFDWTMLKTPMKSPQAQTTHQCRMEETADGRIIDSQTKQVFNYSDPCVARGATIAYNPQAHAEAQKAVKEFVTVVFKLK